MLFRRKDTKLEPYAAFIERGLLAFPPNLVTTETAAGPVTKDRHQTKVTPAELLWLAKRFGVDLSAPSHRAADSDTALAPLSRRRPSSTPPPKMACMSRQTFGGRR